MSANGSAPPSLTVVDGPARGLTVLVAAGGLVMGRTTDADIMLPDPDVSRRHALVRSAGGRTVITDLGSTNGTRVNGRWIEQPWELHPGDEVAVGSCVLRYDAGGAASRPGSDFGTAVMPAAAPRQPGPGGGPAPDDRWSRPGRAPDGGWPGPGPARDEGRPRPEPAPVASQAANVHGGGTVVQGMRDAVHARWHIGTFGTGGLVAGVALILVIAVAVVVVVVNRVSLDDLAGRWRHAGGVTGGMTMEPSTMTVGADGAFRFQTGVRMQAGGLETTLASDCRGEAEPGFGRFAFHSSAGACGDFSGKVVNGGRGLELSGAGDRAPMTLTRTD